jgi:ABC-type cobalamin/Fe3+-siderophores transport system ATPase subunit
MALVGDNGAGKSTLIKGIAGIYAFDEGQVLVENGTLFGRLESGGANRIASNPAAEGDAGDQALDNAAMEAGTD